MKGKITPIYQSCADFRYDSSYILGTKNDNRGPIMFSM